MQYLMCEHNIMRRFVIVNHVLPTLAPCARVAGLGVSSRTAARPHTALQWGHKLVQTCRQGRLQRCCQRCERKEEHGVEFVFV